MDRDAIRRELAAHGLSATKLAKLAGISHVTMMQAMNRRPVTEQTARKIGRALYEAPAPVGFDKLIAGPANPPEEAA